MSAFNRTSPPWLNVSIVKGLWVILFFEIRTGTKESKQPAGDSASSNFISTFCPKSSPNELILILFFLRKVVFRLIRP